MVFPGGNSRAEAAAFFPYLIFRPNSERW